VQGTATHLRITKRLRNDIQVLVCLFEAITDDCLDDAISLLTCYPRTEARIVDDADFVIKPTGKIGL
jgi:hypothetical protein